MNLAHIHLLFNHFPTIGFGIALALFLVGLVGRSEELKRTGLVVFFLIAALALPTYMSGNAAVERLCNGPDGACPEGVSMVTIRAHEDAALFGLIFMEITGFVAWLAIWQYRLISRVPRWSVPCVLLLSVLTFAVMARAANVGGEIRHPEIAAAPPAPSEVPDIEVQGLARNMGAFVNSHEWIWPGCEALHFVGLSVLFTVVLVLDLRILGVAKKIPFAALYQIMPLGMVGFAVNTITGMTFFLATPGQYTQNNIFYWKVVFILMGAVNVLYFMLLDEPWRVGSGDDAPLMARVMAGSAIFIWVGVLFFGHMLPFLGNAF